MTLVAADQWMLITCIISAMVLLSRLAEKTQVGQALSATIISMVLGIALSNSAVVPNDAPVYGYIFTYVVPFALPMFLFEAQWSRIVSESGRLLYLFAAGAGGVVLGAVLAVVIVDMGVHEAAWAGTFSASYIGGTINFVAVSSALELPHDTIAIALSTDTVVGTFLLFFLVVAPGINLVSRALPGRDDLLPHDVADTNPKEQPTQRERLSSQAMGMIVAFSIFAFAFLLTRALGIAQYTILLITVLTLIVANAFPKFTHTLRHAFSVGVALMLSFFFVIGASADIAQMVASGRVFVVFLVVLISSHLLVLFLVSRFFRFGIAEAVVASCACALGPTVAAGVAANRNWRSLVTPGILCGVLGYAIANFLGLAIARALS